MPDAPPIASIIGLPPDATVRAFEARDQLKPTVAWSEMYDADHARAFTVAKVAKLDILGEIQASLADVMQNGGTFEQWRDGLVPYLQKQGWWGDVQDKSLTGTDDTVRVDSRRLRTIYDTNLRVSRAAGQWTRIDALAKQRPFLRYTAVLDSRTRPLHRAWHGTILPVDHPWWDTHFPPCGWFCRCTTRQLSQRDLDAKGWKVTATPPGGGTRTFVPAGGAPLQVPVGIDPGFGYNAGKASMAAIAAKATRSLEATAAVDLAAARATLNDLVQSDAFLDTLSEPGATFPVMVLDPKLKQAIGADVQVVQFSSDNYAKQKGETDRSDGHPELTMADYRLLPAIGASPDHVFADRDQHLVFYKGANGSLYKAAIKRTASGKALFLLSLRFAQPDELPKLLRTFKDLAK